MLLKSAGGHAHLNRQKAMAASIGKKQIPPM